MSRRPWRARLFLAGLAILTLALAVGTAASAYVVTQLGRIDRHPLAEVLTSAPKQPVTAADVVVRISEPDEPEAAQLNDPQAEDSGGDADTAAEANRAASLDDKASTAPSFAGQLVAPRASTGENYLVVGTDSTEGLPADDPLRAGHSDWSRLADVIMVVRLRDDGTAALMSIPRDLAVEVAGTGDIPGTGKVAKINSAYNRDSTTAARAARLIDTIEENFDITLQHFVEADFLGFLRLVDAIGGVQMSFNRPLRDVPKESSNGELVSRSGFAVETGAHLLDGRQALAFVRTRNMQDWTPERGWRTLPGENDLARNDRQREFMLAAVEQAAPGLLGSPIKLLSVLDIAADHVSTSDTLSVVNDGRRLARHFAGFEFSTDAEEYELRVQDTHTPVRWSLELTGDPHNERVLDVFRGIAWEDVVESRVTVQVTGAERVRVTAELRGLGFNAVAGGAVPEGFERPPNTNVVVLGSEGRLAAGLLASHLVPVPEFGGYGELDANTVILHLGGTVPSVDAGYRTVVVPPFRLLSLLSS